MVRTISSATLLIVATLGTGCAIVYDEVESVTPLPGETGVSVDEIPTIRTTTELDMNRASVNLLRAADQEPVAGDVVHIAGDDGYWRLTFAPHAPLDPDTVYTFTVLGALEGYSYLDPITNRLDYFGSGLNDRLEVPFSTSSDPTIRYGKRYAGHAHIYLSFSQDMDPQTLNDSNIEVALNGTPEPPLTFTWDSGPAHQLKITMRRVDFQLADVVILDGVQAIDGAPMRRQTFEVDTSN